MSSEWPPAPEAWPPDPDAAPGSVAAAPPFAAPPFAGPDFSAAVGYPGQPLLPAYPPAPNPPDPYAAEQYPAAPYPSAEYPPVPLPPVPPPPPAPLWIPGHYNEDGQYIPPQYPQALAAQERSTSSPYAWPSAAPVPAAPTAAKQGSTLRAGVIAGLSVIPVVLALMWANATFLQPAHPATVGQLPAASATASSTSKPSATASPSPSASPTAPMPTDPKAILKSNPIYAVAVPAKCPDQARPSSTAEFRGQVKGLVNCENSAWKAALAATPVAFSKPKVKFYDTHITSPCGKLGTTFPAAYCSVDRTLYFSVASYMQGRYYRLAVAQFVMHEYGHHVQELAGILTNRDALNESPLITRRRVELQAHCLAHYGLNHAGLGFDSIDRDDAEYQFTYASDPVGHGTAAASRYWGRRGLAATTIGACNTWSAKAGKVK